MTSVDFFQINFSILIEVIRLNFMLLKPKLSDVEVLVKNPYLRGNIFFLVITFQLVILLNRQVFFFPFPIQIR